MGASNQRAAYMVFSMKRSMRLSMAEKGVGEYTQRPGAGKVPAAIVQLWIRKTRLDQKAEEMLRKCPSTFHLRSRPGFPTAQEARLIGVDLAQLGTHVQLPDRRGIRIA